MMVMVVVVVVVVVAVVVVKVEVTIIILSVTLRREVVSCSTPATTRRTLSRTTARGQNSRSL